MPVSPRHAIAAPLDRLRPYRHHRMDLSARTATHAHATCPFCGRDGKWACDIASGLWRCLVCAAGSAAGGGNAVTFIRCLHEAAVSRADAAFHAAITADRGCSPAAAAAWGAAPSPIDGAWLLPGYGTDGRLDQLYRRSRVTDDGEWVWRLMPTPDVWPDPGRGHALHLPIEDFDPECPDVYICEGPWDGMVFWDAVRGSPIAPCQVIAVPGCNVWRDEWTTFCRGKNVTLLFDSDHPREIAAGRTSRSGYDGMARVAKKLSGYAASVRWLRWGEDGYDPDRPSGWDVRDHLTSSPDRAAALLDLLGRVEDAPAEWSFAGSHTGNGHTTERYGGSIEPVTCSGWEECEAAWREAMHWRRDMSDALAVILAVCASTNQGGNQLFMDLVGSPGIAKTTILRGALTSSHCIHVENITKIISGYKKAGEDVDCSFIARANRKTWITCEFDTILTSAQYTELMGKMRRIFDGETSSTYANTDEDRVYSALRTPWIRAGTPRMMDHDQSQLGDRFLRLIINDPSEEEKRAILRSAIRSERTAMLESCNGTAGSIVDPATRKAYALTGGYINQLRVSTEQQLLLVEVSAETEDICLDLAEMSAYLRARPNEDKRRKENTDGKELPTRLARQYVRLACHLAVVLNKRSVDAEVLRIVRKVALDTAHGHSLNIARWLCLPNQRHPDRLLQETGGIGQVTLENWTGMPGERLAGYLAFLRKIGVLDLQRTANTESWLLTEQMYDLCLRVRLAEL